MVTKFAGALKRIKNFGKKVAERFSDVLRVSSTVGRFIDKYASPIISRVPVIGGAADYLMEKTPQITDSLADNLERISKGENIYKSTKQNIMDVNRILPTNPFGFGYNLKQAYEEGGIQQVINTFTPEAKILLNTIR